MRYYCKHNPHSHILNQWLPKQLKVLTLELDTLVRERCLHLNAILGEGDSVLDVSLSEKKHTDTVVAHVFLLAKDEKLRGATQKTLEDEFEALWSKFAPPSTPALDSAKCVQHDIDKALYQLFPKHHGLVRSAAEKRLSDYSSLSVLYFVPKDIKAEHLYLCSDSDQPSCRDTSESDVWAGCVGYLVTEINGALQDKITEFVEDGKSCEMYTTSAITVVINEVSEWCRQTFTYEGTRINILPALETLLAVAACQILLPELVRIHCKTHSLVSKVTKLKARLWDLFQSLVQQTSTDMMIIISDICKRFQDNLKEGLLEILPEEVRRMMSEAFGTKRLLMIHMLQSLVDNEEFSDFLIYFYNPKGMAIKALKSYTKCIVRDPGFFTELSKLIVSYVKKSIEATLASVSDETPIKASKWVAKFWRNIGRILFKQKMVGDLDSMPDSWIIANVSDFTTKLTLQLELVIAEVLSGFNDMKLGALGLNQWFISRLATDLWGCQATCPFCGEPCCLTSKNHQEENGLSHRCIKHRPHVVSTGACRNTKQASYSNCSYNVTQQNLKFNLEGDKEHKYINYKKYFKDWLIEPNSTVESNVYWQWVLIRFQKEIKAMYDVNDAIVRKSWGVVTKDSAKKSLLY